MDKIIKITDKEIIHQIINVSLKHRRVMQSELDITGVYHSQHRLLMEIARNPNASQVDIAKKMDVSAVTIAVSLKKLEKGGYIKRDIVEEDNRLNKIIITEKGNKVVNQSREIFAATDKRMLDKLTDEERYSLFTLLNKIDNNIANIEEEIKQNKKRKC